MDKTDIKSLSYTELENLLLGMGQPKYRAGQVFSWLNRGVISFEEMTDLSQPLRLTLEETSYITVPNILSKKVSADKTVKYLWGLKNESCVESVLMHYKHGNSVCVSTQAGCKMGCAFCASSSLGFDRNLTVSELIDQLIFTGKDSEEKISGFVLMGVGEPLDNFENVVKFIKLANDPRGLNIGMRHISLSTCGLPGLIKKLAELDLQITLSVSLHAPDDETRSMLMPVNRVYGIRALLSDTMDYYKKTGRRISYEYAMIKGINDSKQQALKLARLLKDSASHINLIALNATNACGYKASDPSEIKAFQHILEQNGLNVTVRRRLGQDIDAACGQLRRRAVTAQKG